MSSSSSPEEPENIVSQYITLSDLKALGISRHFNRSEIPSQLSTLLASGASEVNDTIQAIAVKDSKVDAEVSTPISTSCNAKEEFSLSAVVAQLRARSKDFKCPGPSLMRALDPDVFGAYEELLISMVSTLDENVPSHVRAQNLWDYINNASGDDRNLSLESCLAHSLHIGWDCLKSMGISNRWGVLRDASGSYIPGPVMCKIAALSVEHMECMVGDIEDASILVTTTLDLLTSFPGLLLPEFVTSLCRRFQDIATDEDYQEYLVDIDPEELSSTIEKIAQELPLTLPCCTQLRQLWQAVKLAWSIREELLEESSGDECSLMDALEGRFPWLADDFDLQRLPQSTAAATPPANSKLKPLKTAHPSPCGARNSPDSAFDLAGSGASGTSTSTGSGSSGTPNSARSGRQEGDSSSECRTHSEFSWYRSNYSEQNKDLVWKHRREWRRLDLVEDEHRQKWVDLSEVLWRLAEAEAEGRELSAANDVDYELEFVDLYTQIKVLELIDDDASESESESEGANSGSESGSQLEESDEQTADLEETSSDGLREEINFQDDVLRSSSPAADAEPSQSYIADAEVVATIVSPQLPSASNGRAEEGFVADSSVADVTYIESCTESISSLCRKSEGVLDLPERAENHASTSYCCTDTAVPATQDAGNVPEVQRSWWRRAAHVTSSAASSAIAALKGGVRAVGAAVAGIVDAACSLALKSFSNECCSEWIARAML